MKIGSLFIDLSVNSEKGEATLNQFTLAMTGAVAAGQLIVSTLEAAAEKFEKLASNAMHAALAVEMFETQTGLSGQSMQRWDIIAQQAGVSAGTLASNLTSLQRNINDIRMGGGNIRPFQLMGINPIGQTPQQLLESMRGFYQAMGDKGLASNIIESAGVSPEMLELLKLTNAELKSMVAVPILSTGQINNILALHRAWINLNQVMQAYTNILVATVGPAITNIFKGVSLAVSHFTGILQMCTGATWQMKTAVGSLIIALTAASWGKSLTALISNPIAQFIAAMTIIFLMLDDFYVYSQHGKSVTGEALEGIKKFFMSLSGIVDTAVKKIDTLLERLTGIRAMAGVLQAIGTSLAPITNPGAFLQQAAQPAITVYQYITGSDAGSISDQSADKINQVYQEHIKTAAQQTNNTGKKS